MKKSVFCLLGILLSWGLGAAPQSSSTSQLPRLTAEVEVNKFIAATECYVVFLLEGKGENLSAALANFERKHQNFSAVVRQKFPQAQAEIYAVNYGTQDFSSFRAEEKPFSPNVTKALIYTLPPDEKMALQLVDLGVKAGLLPFCGTSRDGSFGAVFWGLKDTEKAIDALYPQATQQLWVQAKKLAKELNREIVQMDDIMRYLPRRNPYELRFRNIVVVLPSEFCSSSPNKIKISLNLRAAFQVK